ncbi:hypothetical protein [Jonesia quinghaiensis]|uniref:hypothetical protein n=1 Tax=Jonesia quinghaiensis TaxID=262806 RepID=UPI0012F7C2D6|nr:hypothetical protein [Jonesia quinghaiensis]
MSITPLSSSEELWVELHYQRYADLDIDHSLMVDLLRKTPVLQIHGSILVKKSPISRGRKRSDFLWAGGLPIHIVSSGFVDALTEYGATGWETYPIDFVNGRGDEVSGYIGFLEDIGGTGDVKSSYEDMRSGFGMDVTTELFDYLKAKKLRFKKGS